MTTARGVLAGKKVELRTREFAQSVEELRALGEVSQAVNSTLELDRRRAILLLCAHCTEAIRVREQIRSPKFEKLNYNFIRDIAPVASIHRVPHVMQVNPSLPVATVPE